MKRRRVWMAGLALIAAAAFGPAVTAPAVAAPPHHGQRGHHGHQGLRGHHGHRASRSHHGNHGIRRHHRHHGRHHVRHGFRGHLGIGSHGGFGRHRGLGGHARHSVSRYHGLGYSYDPYRYHDPYRSGLRRHPEAPTPTAEAGWSMLRRGDANGAIRVFGALARTHPSDASLKAGYALSAALLDEHRKAVWAMRRAAAADLGSLHYLIGDDRLETVVRDVLAHFAGEAKRLEGNVDALFMTAALHFLLQEDNAALSAVAEAIHRGDSTPTARALYDLLQAEVVGTGEPSMH